MVRWSIVKLNFFSEIGFETILRRITFVDSPGVIYTIIHVCLVYNETPCVYILHNVFNGINIVAKYVLSSVPMRRECLTFAPP